ncbi:hypothetical protein DMH03_26925 [Amycolatopsis sp. WAC 01376]|uniref:DUF6603 domain-containing protein n=1 Tax=Amycolatopsis sp. WAC 01376 TaxID=2203195 RepID=UPI000F7ABDD2|nr:DUF6603 domain-containing protein [Amycolatopsis sp. WAC 01376]RSM56914.1 hypothetical protein DMH03_26925 [Amycolatopsis sp. WAC 01376]
MAGTGLFEKVLAGVGQATLPLHEAVRSPGACVALLQKLGWRVDAVPPALSALGGALDTLTDSLRRLLGDGGLNVGGGSAGGVEVEFSVDDAARVLSALQALIDGVEGIAAAPDSAIPEALRVDGFREKFPRQLLDFLIVTYLQRHHPAVGFGLRTLGVIKGKYAPRSGNRPSYLQLTLDLTDIPRLLGDPGQVLKKAFGWGGPDFDFASLASQLDNLLMSVGVDVDLKSLPSKGAAAVQGTPEDSTAPVVKAVRGTVFERFLTKDKRSAAEIRLVELPSVNGAPVGLALLPYFTGSLGANLPLTDDLTLLIRSDLDFEGGIALRIRPGQGIETIVGFEKGSPAEIDGTIEVTVVRGGKAAEPTLLIGSKDGTRLQFHKIAATGGVRIADGVDVFAEFEIKGLEFVFKPGGADGFIAKLLPGDGFTVGGDLVVGISHAHGFYFRGSANLEANFAAHLKLGPLEIQGFTISASPSGDGIPIGLGTTFKAELGPITAVVEQIGLTADLAFKPGNDGNLGPVDLSLGFKPPKGVGLSVDAGIVSGGGYLYFDPDRGEYAGALELEFAGLVELKAIGLITTRMPDGSEGFSLLIVIATEFGGGGIQLGFGFTLLGVGGVLGLNRRMDFAALLDGVVNGGIESVMFPKDVIANAPRIISDLRRFFPPEEGRFLIGPMAKIGWGTPALVTVSLGVIVEIPPGNVAILGVLKCVLPSEDVALLKLQVNFIGALQVDKSRLWFYAQLFDSRILWMTIEGGMGLLVDWSDNPDFVLSVGGFHPSFKPPPLPFPVPPRLSIDILNSPGRLIRVSGYFAVTSNTAQFGAKAELRLGFGGFGIEGHLAFDALFRFSPFSFIIQISAGVSLKAFGVGVFGIDLDFQLEGPTPWRAHGRGSISLLFFEISADFDITWGEERDTALPPVAVLGLLENEVRKTEGWRTRLPAGGFNPLVTLRQLPGTGDPVLHPLGSLFIHQRAIPLDVRIDRVGAQRPSDGKRFGVVPIPGSGMERASITGDKFAMGQFQDSDDAAKLSRAAYEDQNAGLELVAEKGAIASPRAVRRSARYELYIVDNERPEAVTTLGMRRRRVRMAVKAPAAPKLYSPPPAVFRTLLDGSSTARSPLSQHETRLRQPFTPDETVLVTGDRFVVAYRRNNLQAFPPSKAGSTLANFRSEASAADAMADWIVADASLAGQLHVLRRTEAGGAGVTEPGTWSSAGEPPSSASGADAVRLVAGKVLVVAGAGASGKPVTTTALFDPVSVSWEAGVSQLKSARVRHGTARFADGRVVAAGGQGADGTPLASAEVFDPATKAWADAGNLTTARSGHTATPVGAQVLVTGGVSARGAALASAELLDPRTLQWTPILPMTDARTGHQAVLLTDEKTKKVTGVLVVGGAVPTGQGERALATCEIYDLATKEWLPTGGLAVPRKGHQATVLPDGRVLVTGGDAVGGLPYRPESVATAEIYCPADRTWARVAELPGGGRSGHRCVVTPIGAVVIGGVGRPGATAGYRATVAFDPGSGTWRATGAPADGRRDFAAVDLADGRVFVAGGLTRTGASAPGPDPAELSATAEIYLS